MELMKKILIVEDNYIIALDLKSIIVKLGFYVSDIADTISKVENSLLSNKPDLIIMDIFLKDNNNGVEIVKKLYQKEYIPVIYLTGCINENILEKAINTKPIAYLVKPFKYYELKAAIKLAFIHEEEYVILDDNYYFDNKKQILYNKEGIVKISKKEKKLLYLLLLNKKRNVSFEKIEEFVYENELVSNDAIRLLVSRIRKKLKSSFIKSVYAYGFKIE